MLKGELPKRYESASRRTERNWYAELCDKTTYLEQRQDLDTHARDYNFLERGGGLHRRGKQGVDCRQKGWHPQGDLKNGSLRRANPRSMMDDLF